MRLEGLFGTWLKQRRKSLDLTQKELADEVICSVVTIRKMEANLLRPSREIAERLADALVIDPEQRAQFIAFARQKPEKIDRTHPYEMSPQPTPFVGKITELKQISGYLNDPACRLLTLVGVGGSGKTRLAIEAGRTFRDQFAHGCCFVSLAAIDSPQLIPMAIADALNFSFQPQEEPKTQIINYLHEKQILLVMDNFEHVLDEADFVSEMLQQASRLKIIATSRERLNLREEWVLPVAGMTYPDSSQADGNSYDAVQLFSQCARRIRPDFSLEEYIDGVVAICRTVEGLPLALEIAATWISVMPLEQIASQLQQGTQLLTTSLRNIDERHRSMMAVFNHSRDLLSEPERRALMALSVFRGGFESQTAEQVAGATLPVLAGLVDKSMIRMQKTGRYDMHELVRQYAAEMLETSGQTDVARQTHGNYYAEFLKWREKELVSWGQLQAMRELAAEWDNVRVACDWIIAHRDFDALDLAIEALYLYGIEFRIVDLQAFWRQAMPRFAPQPEEEPHIAWGRLLSRSIFVLGLHGSGEDIKSEAMRLDLEKSFEIAGHYGRNDEIAYSLFAKGLYLHSFDDDLQAINYFEKSAILCHQIGDHFGEAHAHEWMGDSLGALGQKDASVQHTQIALRMFREQGDLYEAGWALLTLSFLPFYYTGNVKEAETFLHEAQQIHQSFGSPTACMMIEHHLKYIALWRGDLQQVEAEFNRPPTPQNTHSTRYHELNIPGISKVLQGDYGAALAVFNSLSTAFIEENLANAWQRYWGRLLAYSGIGDYASARQCLELMYRAYLERPDFLLVVILALPVHAFMLAQEGKFELAAQLLGLISCYPSNLTGWTKVWLPTKQLPEVLRAQLGSEAFDAALAAGRDMTLDEAVALAVGTSDLSVSSTPESRS